MTCDRVSGEFGAGAAGGVLVARVGSGMVVSAVGGVAATVFPLPPLGAGVAAAVVAGATVA
jgi:hypothetical protein